MNEKHEWEHRIKQCYDCKHSYGDFNGTECDLNERVSAKLKADCDKFKAK